MRDLEEKAHGEAAAWMYSDGADKFVTFRRDTHEGMAETPLYAAPQAPATGGDEKLPDHVAEFLFAVLTCPGRKRPVDDYYPAGWDWENGKPLPPPSWKIAEQNGWVECVGSHKWRILPAGEIALFRHRLAALTNHSPDAGGIEECPHDMTSTAVTGDGEFSVMICTRCGDHLGTEHLHPDPRGEG